SAAGTAPIPASAAAATPAIAAFSAPRRSLFVVPSLVLMNHLQVCAAPAPVRALLPCSIRLATLAGRRRDDGAGWGMDGKSLRDGGKSLRDHAKSLRDYAKSQIGRAHV